MVFNDPLEHQKVSDEFVHQAVISETLTGSFDEMPVGKRWHLIRVTCSAAAG